MKRRDFSVAAVSLAVLAPRAWAQGKPPQEGADYRTLEKPAPMEAAANKIEVVEFFWYSCPHCNAFEPLLQDWSKRIPPDISLRRVPAAFRDDMVPQQRLFYALEAMGKLDELHVKVFDAIHKEHVDLTRQQGMAEWLAKQGVDAPKFVEIYNSFAISARARRATDLQNAYDVEGVPSFGVAGRWYVDGVMTAGNPRMLQVVEALVGQVRKTR